MNGEAKPPRLINRKALRAFLLQEHAEWGNKPRRNVSPAFLDEIEASFRRFVIAQASQELPGRKTGNAEE